MNKIMENKKTIVTFESNGDKMTFEMPWDATIDEVCHAFYTACIGMGFTPNTVVHAMKEFADEWNFEKDEPEND